jgi:hypothetical protein
MDKLKKNAFWAGVAGALILLAILFAVLVPPKVLAQANLGKQIRNKNTELANLLKNGEVHAAESIQQWNDRKQQMLASYKKITDFYAASDRHFERWFDGFNGQDRGTFMARYREEIQKLEDSVTARKTEIGIPDPNTPALRRFGFNWEEPLPDQWTAILQGGAGEEARVLKELQKRFWARQRVANALLKPDVTKVTRVHDFRFFRRLAQNLTPVPGWEQPPTANDAVSWPGVRMDQRNFQEFEFPNELGKTFTFGFALLLPYNEVPKILKEILNPDIEPRNDNGADRLLVNLIGAQVSLRDQNRPTLHYWHYEGDEAHKKAQLEKALAEAGMTGEVQARDVLLAVTCQIVDFEPAKVKKLDLDAPEPAPPKP